MGQCTSGELPPPVSDGVDEAIATENGDYQPQPEMSCQKASGRRLFGRRSSNSSWVSNRFSRGRKAKDLSATFNMLDYDAKVNLLNVNAATEEELMTLPGVPRAVARNIVEYRTAIGGFRRVEDLALVSGVGAAKLQTFMCDITVKKSRSSSRTQSVDSLPSCESGRSQRSHSQSHSGRSLRGSPVHAINVNAASIFELMNVRGMNQEMAANIVEYRERKGPFKNIEELVKVRRISARVLSFLKIYLTVNNVPPGSPPVSDIISVASYSKVYQRNLDVKMPGHRRTHSAPLNNNVGNSPGRLIVDPKETADPRISIDFSADIFELLSLRSERPIIKEVFNGYSQGQPAIRVATWNLQQLTKDKICNPGVLEVVCRTIMENGFSLLAIQEVGSKDVLEKICCELNQSSLRRVREWGGPKGEWRWQVSEEPAGRLSEGIEYAAFMYNVCHGLHLLSATLLDVHSNNNSKACKSVTRKPYLGYFKSFDFEFVVVSLHIDSIHLKNKTKARIIDEIAEDEPDGAEETRSGAEASQLTPLVNALKEKLISERNIILFGDFGLFPEDAAFDVLREASYSSIVPADNFTDVSASNGKGSCCDNIWLNPHTRMVYTGNWGVVREGLTHLAIPCGWGWGGVVSDHCPIYCDLYSQCDPEPGQSGAVQPNENTA